MHNKFKSFVSKTSIFTRPWVVSRRRAQLRQQHSLLECIHDAADRGINSAGIIFLLNDSISDYQSQNLTDLSAYGIRRVTYLWFKSYLLCWKQFVKIMQNDSRNSVQKKYVSSHTEMNIWFLGHILFVTSMWSAIKYKRGQRWFYLQIIQTCCLPKKYINKCTLKHELEKIVEKLHL
jgi:hypothetical protein